MKYAWRRSAGAALGLAVAAATGASAQELKLGGGSEVTSVEPHFHNVGPKNALRRHVFEGLVCNDENQKIKPELAASFRAVDDTTGEFKLRPGVKFSNGA